MPCQSYNARCLCKFPDGPWEKFKFLISLLRHVIGLTEFLESKPAEDWPLTRSPKRNSEVILLRFLSSPHFCSVFLDAVCPISSASLRFHLLQAGFYADYENHLWTSFLRFLRRLLEIGDSNVMSCHAIRSQRHSFQMRQLSLALSSMSLLGFWNHVPFCQTGLHSVIYSHYPASEHGKYDTLSRQKDCPLIYSQYPCDKCKILYSIGWEYFLRCRCSF